MLYNKYRPRKFSEFVGNSETVNAIAKLVKDGSFPHSVIFYGESGCGKTTMARILRKKLGCEKEDYREINAADFRGIDTIRGILDEIGYLPRGESKIYVFDEAHQLTTDAQNSLLKVLEDPPEFVYFFLLTTNPQKLLTTITTRCSSFEFLPLSRSEFDTLIKRIEKNENVRVGDDIVDLIFEVSLGRPRHALSILEKVISVDEKKRKKVILSYIDKKEQAIKLARLLMKPGFTWKEVTDVLKRIEDEPESVRKLVISYCSTVLLSKDDPHAYLVLDAFVNSFYYDGKAKLIKACYEIYNIYKEG